MASSFSPPRLAALLLPILPIAGCTLDRLVPPAEIGSNPSEDRQLVGRVDGSKDYIGRVGEPAAYAATTEPRNAGSDGIDYLNTPNLAGTGSDAVADEQTVEVMPAQEEIGVSSANVAEAPAGGYYAIPSEGVSMDAELGVATGEENQMLVPEAQPVAPGDMTIAEGATDQPVVDGIGTDNPTPYLSAPAQEDVPEPAYTGSVGKNSQR